jgi:hypothetical protein
VTPSVPEQIGGLVEVPALAASLTLNKADFIRTGPRGAVYLTYGKAHSRAAARDAVADRRRTRSPAE